NRSIPMNLNLLKIPFAALIITCAAATSTLGQDSCVNTDDLVLTHIEFLFQPDFSKASSCTEVLKNYKNDTRSGKAFLLKISKFCDQSNNSEQLTQATQELYGQPHTGTTPFLGGTKPSLANIKLTTNVIHQSMEAWGRDNPQTPNPIKKGLILALFAEAEEIANQYSLRQHRAFNLSNSSINIVRENFTERREHAILIYLKIICIADNPEDLAKAIEKLRSLPGKDKFFKEIFQIRNTVFTNLSPGESTGERIENILAQAEKRLAKVNQKPLAQRFDEMTQGLSNLDVDESIKAQILQILATAHEQLQALDAQQCGQPHDEL
ncbi:MAG TPA: hypothetical protein PLV25_03910, partial [Opitutales bacterium]|nr:hypothetical protein [Opitutales bacterium]